MLYTMSDEKTPYKATKINVIPYQHYGLQTARKKYSEIQLTSWMSLSQEIKRVEAGNNWFPRDIWPVLG